jgi:hypothetical protein
MATVNKNFKVKYGLIVEGTTATVNTFDILTKSTADVDYIISQVGGSGASTNTPDTLVLRDSSGDFAAATITAETGFSGDLTGDVTGNVTGNADTASALATARTISVSGDATGTVTFDGSANADIAVTLDASFATDTEVTAAADAAELAANSYTDVREGLITTAYQGYANQAETDANTYTDGEISTLEGSLQTYADTAESDANAYTDSLVGDASVDGSAGNTVTDRVATAVANLVDSAPAALDTLNELAAALGDNPDFVTTITASIGEKVAKSGDTMTGALTLSGAPTLAGHASTKAYVDAAQAAAESYADGIETTLNTTIDALTTDDVAEGANEYYTTAKGQTDAASLLTGASLTNITITGSGAGLTITAENGVADSTTADLTEDPSATGTSGTMYFTDARAQTAVASDIATAKSEAVSTASTDASTKATAAQTAAQGYADTLVALGDATATPSYLALDVNSVALQVAATQTVATASLVVGYSWAHNDYKSAELIVKVTDGTDSEISKVLLTIDSSNNVAITEYGNVQTNGALAAVTAGIDGTDLQLLVTTANNNSNVVVSGTLMV